MTIQLPFVGTPAERAWAEQIHDAMRLQARFYAKEAPIRQSLKNIVSYFVARHGGNEMHVTQEIRSALNANHDIFALEITDDDEIIITTSTKGKYVPLAFDRSHSLAHRLYEPENPLPVDDMSVVLTTNRPTVPVIEPVFISDYWLNGATSSESDQFTEERTDHGFTSSDTLVPDDVIVGQQHKTKTVNPRDAMRINLPQGISIDLAQPTANIMQQHGDAIVSALRGAIEKDTLKRIAVFGNQVALERDVRTFSKNEIRQITDYIESEVGEPVTDSNILQNIINVNLRSVDFERQRFALNFRLLKDLEFVGVNGANLWATRKLLDKIGANKRIKTADMGSIVLHLEEGFDDSVNVVSAESIQAKGSVTHTLTYFEWEYGILPLTKALAAVLPEPVINRQSAAVVTFEVPQHNFSFGINVRFPAGARGGWLQGFDEFFHSILVPGAMLTISRTTQPNVVSITYTESDERIESLLTIEEGKKKSKFTFEERQFTCMVDEELLPTISNVGRIRRIKFFELNERKNLNTLIEALFAGFGEKAGTKQDPLYQIEFEQLYNLLTIYRSVTRNYVLHSLQEHQDCRLVNSAAGLWECRVDIAVPERGNTSFEYDDEDEE
jgi:hypothetical protein